MSHSKFVRLTEENEQLTKQLQDTQIVLDRARSEIKEYNQVIESMIAGGSPCDWCEDQRECKLQAKADGKGCESWWLRYRREEDAHESEGILHASEVSGGKTSDIAGQIKAF